MCNYMLRNKWKNSLVVSKKVHHCFFQAVEMSVHKACFDVHPGMSAGQTDGHRQRKSTYSSSCCAFDMEEQAEQH